MDKCIICAAAIPGRSTRHTRFFCSKECAEKWADDFHRTKENKLPNAGAITEGKKTE